MKTKKQKLLLISHEKEISNKLNAILKQLFSVQQITFDCDYQIHLSKTVFQLVLLIGIGSHQDLLVKLKEFQYSPNFPRVILISDINEASFIVQSYRLGIIDYIQLPINLGELIKVLNTHLKAAIVAKSNTKEVGMANIWNKIKPSFGKNIIEQETYLIAPNIFTEHQIVLDNIAFMEVNFLGKFTIRFQNQNIENLFGKRAKSILAYLLFHYKKPVNRDKLVEIFWPYHATNPAKNNLNVAICGIRRIFQKICPNIPVLKLENDYYVFSSNIIINTDSSKFEQFYRKAKAINNNVNSKNAAKEFQSIVKLYQGDFLEEIYDSWIEQKRDYYRDIYLNSLNQLSNTFFNSKQYIESIKYNKLMLEKDACLEDVHRKLMICYHALDQTTKVIRQFRKCEKTLQEELGISTSKKTLELLVTLRN